MLKRCLALAMVLTGVILYVIPGSVCAEEAAVMVNKQPALICALPPAGGSTITGNGYIAYETKNVDELYEQIKKIITKHQAIVKNFNMNNSPDMKYKNVNLEVTVDIEDGPSFMNEISSLKTVKNQNYNQYAQSESSMETMKQDLAVYNDRLNKAVANGKPDVEVIKLLVSKINETESRIKSLEMNQPMINKARINITIQQKGYPANYDPRAKNDVPVIITVIIAGLALFCFGLGLFSVKLITRIRKKKADGQV